MVRSNRGNLAPVEKKVLLLGLGLDNDDGQKRVTESEKKVRLKLRGN